MVMTATELQEITAQAAREYPSEACGVIVGRDGERRVMPCRNIQDEKHVQDPATYTRTARNAYYMHPMDVLAWNRLVDQGWTLLVVYHSHPDAGPYFSETDRAQAIAAGVGEWPAYAEATQVVISVVGGAVKGLAAYRWNARERGFDRVDTGDIGVTSDGGHPQSRRLFATAERVIPGGVNSPVRAFRGVGGEPVFVARAEGARIWDVDGRSYVDFVGSWGPLILGHAAPQVVEAVIDAARRGTSYGAPTAGEVELAEVITRAVPSMEMVRLVSSGTEATMTAIRLARGATGRDVIVKFDGGYHGHADSLLVRAGSGGATFSIPDSAGVPAALAALTVTVAYNDLDAIRDLFRTRGAEIAAVIVEPVAGNMGVVPPAPGFLQGLREITSSAGALLVFDEVITGFRLAYGGAQAVYGVKPDLTCLGKIIGGGLPVGAYGGRRDVMQKIAPLGPVYQAGTLSGNPLAVAAGLAMLRALREPGVYERLEHLGGRLERGLRVAADKSGIPITVNRIGSMLTGFFTDRAVTDYATAKRAEVARYAAFFHAMLERGIALAPSQFEAAFVSLAHADGDIDRAGTAALEALTTLR